MVYCAVVGNCCAAFLSRVQPRSLEGTLYATDKYRLQGSQSSKDAALYPEKQKYRLWLSQKSKVQVILLRH